MIPITREVYTSMGLNDAEYALILELTGREPNYTELGMFAVMWSEHCGYKYSRPVLAYFSKYREAMEGAGLENAGVVDLGDGMGITMKVESHNHPSAVEPYQGAATGVGGIIRDILTMGARPLANLNALRFGPITEGSAPPNIVARNRYLFEHVVAGIAGYGNCVGVPTVAGEIHFHPRYSGNPLVNAMNVGILPLDGLTTAAASGVGNPVIYLGSRTGKDGIHGATFASDTLGEDNEDKRPNVQIGDPFAEKLLIEATLEALQTGAVVAIQDMGAAGLTCSTIEMAAKGDVGMSVNLDLVPMRESDMTGYELMLSESQERMLAVAHAGREAEVINVFHRYGLPAVVIGHVTDDHRVRVTRWEEVVADVDPHLLADRCPTYSLPLAEPSYFSEAAEFDPSKLEPKPVRESLLQLLATPDIASKRWVYQQFDQQVQTQTNVAFGRGDAAVLSPRGTSKAIALSLDGNARATYLHPYRGGVLAVLEAARNVACAGGRPVAATDGLNFGSPQELHVYWQFERAVKGIADAAEVLQTPVISGNVSFYNQSDLGEVLPTPLIGMLGILDDPTLARPSAPAVPCTLVLVETERERTAHHGLGASALLAEVYGLETGYPEPGSPEKERDLHRFLSTERLESAHDCSEGGLLVAVAEVCLQSGFGLQLDIAPTASDLFGEFPGRVIVGAVDPDHVIQLAAAYGLNAQVLGELVETGELRLGQEISWSIEELRETFEESIAKCMAER